VSDGKTSRSCGTQPTPPSALRWDAEAVTSAPRQAIVPWPTSAVCPRTPVSG
jgi:hypothetical protein